MINIYKFHLCPSLLATPGFEPTTFRSQSGDANHSATPPPLYLSDRYLGDGATDRRESLHDRRTVIQTISLSDLSHSTHLK